MYKLNWDLFYITKILVTVFILDPLVFVFQIWQGGHPSNLWKIWVTICNKIKFAVLIVNLCRQKMMENISRSTVSVHPLGWASCPCQDRCCQRTTTFSPLTVSLVRQHWNDDGKCNFMFVSSGNMLAYLYNRFKHEILTWSVSVLCRQSPWQRYVSPLKFTYWCCKTHAWLKSTHCTTSIYTCILSTCWSTS